jgi:hypothetical protein
LVSVSLDGVAAAAVACCRALQVLEGEGNHYHFVVPQDMAINASRLLAEVEEADNATGAAGGEEGWALFLSLLAHA